MATVDGGAHWRQVSLPGPGRPWRDHRADRHPERLHRSRPSGQRHIRAHRHLDLQGRPDLVQPTQTADSKITALTAVGTEVYGTAERGATPSVVTVPAP